MSIKIEAVSFDVIATLRHELRNAGLHEKFHPAVISACHAAGLFDVPDQGDIADKGDVRDGALNAAAAKQSRLAKLNAAKDDPAHRSNIIMLEGLLRRGGVSMDDVAGADLPAIDKAFASSRLTVSDRIAAKAILHRYGAI